MYVLIKCHLNISRAISVHSFTMPPFPWDAFKAETLRLMCKDLGAGAGVKRTRGDMISFLKGVETRGCTCSSSTFKFVSYRPTFDFQWSTCWRVVNLRLKVRPMSKMGSLSQNPLPFQRAMTSLNFLKVLTLSRDLVSIHVLSIDLIRSC